MRESKPFEVVDGGVDKAAGEEPGVKNVALDEGHDFLRLEGAVGPRYETSDSTVDVSKRRSNRSWKVKE